jgi:methionine-gamma-lyase
VERRHGFSTRAIHEADLPLSGISEEPVSPPLWMTSDYLYEGLEHYADVMNERRPGYVYGRYGNPTHVQLDRVLASLEGAEAAWSFASGMAAIHTALTSMLQQGDRVVAQSTLYGGTFALFTQVFPRYGIEAGFADPTRQGVEAALTPNAKVVFLETLANPTFRVTDVKGIGELCAERGIPLVVDNTVATPVLLRPLEVPGVTLVVHATTKYIGGHSDLIGGSAAGPQELIDRIRTMAIEQGTTQGGFPAWLTLRGVQTLALRFERQCSTALAVATALAANPKVESVGYSGLPDHPDHALATDLFGGAGYGAMLAFELDGGYEAARRACDALRIARVGSSFGSLRTQVCHPATTSHRQLTPEERAEAGIGDGLIRCAIGGEDPEDLIEDFARALEKA